MRTGLELFVTAFDVDPEMLLINEREKTGKSEGSLSPLLLWHSDKKIL